MSGHRYTPPPGSGGGGVGPQGPQGPEGPEGPQGPPGPNDLTTRVLTADVTNSTVVVADLSDLAIVAPGIGTYYVECFIMYTTAAAGTGIRPTLRWPTGSAAVAILVNETTTAARRWNPTAPSALDAAAAASLGATPMPLRMQALVVVTVADGDIVPQIASETAASAVTAKAGSVLRYRQVA